MPSKQVNIMSFFSRSAVPGANAPNNNSAAGVSSKTSAPLPKAAGTSSKTSVPSNTSVSSKTSAQIVSSSRAPTREASVDVDAASASQSRVNQRDNKRSRKVVESDSDSDVDLPAVGAVTKSQASKRARVVESDPESDSDAPLVPRKTAQPASRVVGSSDDGSSAPWLSAAAQFAPNVTIPVPSYSADPQTFAGLVVFVMTALLTYAKAHVDDLDSKLTVDLLSALYIKAMQQASPSLFAYLDHCCRNAIPWDYETFYSLLAEVNIHDRHIHAIYHLLASRTHNGRAGHLHAYGGSATHMDHGVHGRLNYQHLVAKYRQQILQQGYSYLYKLVEQVNVQVDFTGRAALKLSRTKTSEHGRMPWFFFETMNIHLFCGWKFDFVLPKAFPCLLPSRLQTAFALFVGKTLAKPTAQTESEILSLCLKVRGTNSSIPLLEYTINSSLVRLKMGGGTVSSTLYQSADYKTSWVFRLVPNQFCLSSEALGMISGDVKGDRTEIDVQFFLTAQPTDDNFAGVPADFQHVQFPDVSRLVCHITWIDVNDHAHIVPYKLTGSTKGKTPAQTKLFRTVFAQSLWDHIVGSEPDKDALRIDVFSAPKTRSVDEKIADQIFGQASAAVDDGQLHCKRCGYTCSKFSSLTQHLGVYPQFTSGKNQLGYNLDPATKARILECRRRGYGSDSLSILDVRRAHNLPVRKMTKAVQAKR